MAGPPLTTRAVKTLFRRRWRGEEIRVVERRGRRELFLGDEWQGVAPGGRGWYWDVMAREAMRRQSRSLLLVGLGAGTTARLAAAAGFSGRLVAVEHSPAVLAARRFFSMPRGLRVVRADAADFARTRGETFDAIAEDVFGAATELVPSRARGLDAGYFRGLFARLLPGGTLMVNVFSAPEYDGRRRRLLRVLARLGRVRVLVPARGANEVWCVTAAGARRR